MLATVGAITGVIAKNGERSISLYNIHTKETVTVVYKRGDKYLEAGLEQVNQILRDHRRNEATKMDPELIDLLWEMHSELGSKEPIHVISGYRSRATNEQLRRTVGGQASESRHILGKAADVHFPDVPVKNLRYSALIRERGGVGYYPTSAIPFIHVDTDRVRSWPRLPRPELALLFPTGSTKHLASDGGTISKEDVQVAQAKHRDLAMQLAAFHDERLGSQRAVAQAPPASTVPRQQVAALPPDKPATPAAAPAAVASAAPPKSIQPAAPSAADRARLTDMVLAAATAPLLVSGPVPARRPQPALPSLTGNTPVAGLNAPPSPTATAPPTPKLAAVDTAAGPAAHASLLSDAGSRFGFVGNWVPAPAYDEEHPEELSYRPFPIAPLLTSRADEPLMSELVHHDVARTVDMIDQTAGAPVLRFRPSEQAARLLWAEAQKFTGEAIGLAKLREAQSTPPGGITSRPVRTSQK